jgi:hypothetical protein
LYPAYRFLYNPYFHSLSAAHLDMMSSLWLAKKEQLSAQEMVAVGTTKTRRWL